MILPLQLLTLLLDMMRCGYVQQDLMKRGRILQDVRAYKMSQRKRVEWVIRVSFDSYEKNLLVFMFPLPLI